MKLEGKFTGKKHCVNMPTVKFLNFRTPEIFCCNLTKIQTKSPKFFCQNRANGMANSEDANQTAPLGAV